MSSSAFLGVSFFLLGPSPRMHDFSEALPLVMEAHFMHPIPRSFQRGWNKDYKAVIRENSGNPERAQRLWS